MEKFTMHKFGFTFEIYINDDKSIRAKIKNDPLMLMTKEVSQYIGISRCDDKDEFNKNYGIYLAIKRVLSAAYGKHKEQLKYRIKKIENEENNIQETLSYLMEKYKNKCENNKIKKEYNSLILNEITNSLKKLDSIKVKDKSNEIVFTDGMDA